MDLFDLVGLVWRRKLLVLPIVAVTLGLAAWVQTATPAEYEATGWLVLETPNFDGARAENPVDLAGMAPELQQELGTTFTVNPTGGGNFVVSAVDGDAEVARAEVDDAISALGQQVTLNQIAQQVDGAGRVELRRVTETTTDVQEDTSFVAEATVFLFDPAGVTANPYQPNAYTGRLLQVAVMGGEGEEDFQQLAGEDIEFIVGQESRDAAALLQVLTLGPDEDRVVGAFSDVRDLLQAELDERQDRANVLASQRLTLEVVDAPLEASDESAPVGRAAVGVVALGGLLCLGVLLFTEIRAMRRERDYDGPLAGWRRDDADEAAASVAASATGGLSGRLAWVRSMADGTDGQAGEPEDADEDVGVDADEPTTGDESVVTDAPGDDEAIAETHDVADTSVDADDPAADDAVDDDTVDSERATVGNEAT